jgi:hypothetical protein
MRPESQAVTALTQPAIAGSGGCVVFKQHIPKKWKQLACRHLQKCCDFASLRSWQIPFAAGGPAKKLTKKLCRITYA